MASSKPTRSVAVVGAYGHWITVLDDMAPHVDARVEHVAPGFDGEDLAPVLAHPCAAGGARVHASVEALLKQARPDVALVSTRLDRIAPAALALLRAGVPVICEKPLALSLSALDELEREATPLIAMMTMRSEGLLQEARRMVRAGDLGRVVLCNARKSYKWGERPAWFGERALYGDTLGWIGIHGLDMINFVTGERVAEAAVFQSNVAHPERPACQDSVAVSARLASGANATISADYCRPASAATHGDDWLRVVGDRGVMEVDLARGELRVDASESFTRRASEVPAGESAFLSFLLDPGSCRRGDALLTREESFHLTRAVLAARRG